MSMCVKLVMHWLNRVGRWICLPAAVVLSRLLLCNIATTVAQFGYKLGQWSLSDEITCLTISGIYRPIPAISKAARILLFPSAYQLLVIFLGGDGTEKAPTPDSGTYLPLFRSREIQKIGDVPVIAVQRLAVEKACLEI